jgi:hypothetical protein
LYFKLRSIESFVVKKMSGFATDSPREVVRRSQATTVPDSVCGVEGPEDGPIKVENGVSSIPGELLLTVFTVEECSD